MKRFLLGLLAVVSLAVALSAASSIEGQWRVEFATPLGQRGVNMTIEQRGAKLAGHVADEYGEYPLSGTFVDHHVTVRWTVPEQGHMLDITMRGTLDGNTITGTATLGKAGEGALTARRTGTLR